MDYTPFFPTASGNAANKDHVVASVEQIATAWAIPSVTSPGDGSLPGSRPPRVSKLEASVLECLKTEVDRQCRIEALENGTLQPGYVKNKRTGTFHTVPSGAERTICGWDNARTTKITFRAFVPKSATPPSVSLGASRSSDSNSLPRRPSAVGRRRPTRTNQHTWSAYCLCLLATVHGG